jgi:hypothetical protein
VAAEITGATSARCQPELRRWSPGVFLSTAINNGVGVPLQRARWPGQLGGFDVSKKREEGPRQPPLRFSIYLYPSEQ